MRAAACFVETLRDAANLCALLAPNLQELLVPGLDHVTVTVDQCREVLHRAEGLLDFETSLPGCRRALLRRPRDAARSPAVAVRGTAAARAGRRCGLRDLDDDSPAAPSGRRAVRTFSPRAFAASVSAASSASSAGTRASSSAIRLRSRSSRSSASPTACSSVSDSAWVSRRSVWVRANASELAENPASWVSSWRLSSASR